jgi:hypothetical protein
LPEASDLTKPTEDKPTCVRDDEVDIEVSKVADEGIVVPLILVAVATPRDGVVKLGLISGAYEASVPPVLRVGLGI